MLPISSLTQFISSLPTLPKCIILQSKFEISVKQNQFHQRYLKCGPSSIKSFLIFVTANTSIRLPYSLQVSPCQPTRVFHQNVQYYSSPLTHWYLGSRGPGLGAGGGGAILQFNFPCAPKGYNRVTSYSIEFDVTVTVHRDKFLQ